MHGLSKRNTLDTTESHREVITALDAILDAEPLRTADLMRTCLGLHQLHA